MNTIDIKSAPPTSPSDHPLIHVADRIIPRPSMSAHAGEWVDANVHAWSIRMQQTVTAELPSIVSQSITALEPVPVVRLENAIKCCQSEMARLLGADSLCTITPVFDKFRRRVGLRDMDLLNMSPAGLFIMNVNVIHGIGSREAWLALYDILSDIGTTCIQGDSHRLLSLYIALVRSLCDTVPCVPE
jgi:hypothetical protein